MTRPPDLRARVAGVRLALARQGDQVRVRVTLAATGAALVAAVLGSVLFVATLSENLERSLQSSAASEIQTVEAQLRRGATPDEAVVTGREDIFVQILDRSGRVLGADHDSLTDPVRRSAGRSEGVRVPGLHDSFAVLAERVGDDLVVVGRSEEQVEKARTVTSSLLAVSVPLGLVALAVVVWLSVGRALRPVEAMRRRAETITSEHLHRRLEVPAGHDEIPLLARTLNEMLDRIDASHQLQRQFVSDASHELRSPLASLRQMAEVAHRYPAATTTSALAEDVLAEESRMEDLVAALLTLARLDDGASPHLGAVDLDDLVLEAASTAGEGAGLDVSAVSSGQVMGSPVLLRQVVRNLVGNARRHARSRVWLSLTETDTDVVLGVCDDGDGIPAELRESVFERFVRLDEARTRDAGGAGLGLSIVKKVTETLGGSVRVDEGPHGGARFTVSLPRADRAEDLSTR